MEDLGDVIQRKTWTVEEFLSQLDELEEDAKRLSHEERERIPEFSGDWSEKSVRKHLSEVARAVKNPIKFKNKERLEQIGVRTDGIADDVLGDTSGLDKVVELFLEVREISESLMPGDYLAIWLKEGTESARQKLEEVVNAKPAFERVLGSEVIEELGSELLRRSMEDVSFLSEAETAILRFTRLDGFGVVLDWGSDSDEFLIGLKESWNGIQRIQEEYGVSREEIQEVLGGETLLETSSLLEKMDQEYSERKRKLSEEWQTYAITLESLGETVLEPPETLGELGEAIENLRNECLERLGESGLSLLRFIKGKDEFPDIGIEEIKKALEALRPFFLKSLTEVS